MVAVAVGFVVFHARSGKLSLTRAFHILYAHSKLTKRQLDVCSSFLAADIRGMRRASCLQSSPRQRTVHQALLSNRLQNCLKAHCLVGFRACDVCFGRPGLSSMGPFRKLPANPS